MKINNKGYASTIIMFSILTLFLISMLMLVKTMNNSSSLNKQITDKIVDNIDYDASGSVQDRLSVLENKVSNLKSEVINEIYPVGSIYMSTEDDTIEKVQSKFGGKWEVYAGGRTIIGVGTGTDSNGIVKKFTNGSTGGEYTHKLTISEMPSHEHNVYSPDGHSWASGFNYSNNPSNKYGATFLIVPDYINDPHIYGGRPMYAAATGGSGAHNNIEPYIATYIYKRIG